jgi:hypothetical protein
LQKDQKKLKPVGSEFGALGSAHQGFALANQFMVYFLACRSTDIKRFDQRSPLVCHCQHGIQPVPCPPCVDAALLCLLHQMTAGDEHSFAANVHLVLTTGALAVRQVKARGKLPVPLRIHAVSQVFGMVIPVVKKHIEYRSLKCFLHLTFIPSDHASGA